MKYTDTQRLEKICDYSNKLLSLISNKEISRNMLMTDYAAQWMVTTPLYNIGEHTYCVSSELKAKYPMVPWAKISGLRHRLVHNYDDTNWSIIVQVIFEDLAPFAKEIQKILETETT